MHRNALAVYGPVAGIVAALAMLYLAGGLTAAVVGAALAEIAFRRAEAARAAVALRARRTGPDDPCG